MNRDGKIDFEVSRQTQIFEVCGSPGSLREADNLYPAALSASFDV